MTKEQEINLVKKYHEEKIKELILLIFEMNGNFNHDFYITKLEKIIEKY